MATAVAVTAATGIYSAYSGYQAAGVQADNIEAQAKQDKLDAEAQMEMDSRAEASEASALRAKNRRLRAIQEAAFAKSGVLMEGSAADVMTKQRETDEVNVQNFHTDRSNQRAQDRHKVARDYQSSMYLADATKSAAKTNLVTNILSTAASTAMGIAKIPKAPSNPMTDTAFPTPKPLGKLPSSNIGTPSSIWNTKSTNPLLAPVKL